MILTTKGIIVKTVDYGESNRILTVVTQDFGKVSIVVNGARSKRSKHKEGTEIFSYNLFSFFNNRNVYKLEDVDILESFNEIKCSFELLSYVAYFAEILCFLVQESIADRGQLNIFLNALRVLNKTKVNPKKVKPVYELRSLSVAGFKPNITKCVTCKSNKNLEYFTFKNGGTLCNDCAKDVYEKIKLDKYILKAMQYIINYENNKIFSFKASGKFLDCLDNITEKYVKTHLDKDFKSLHYLKACSKSFQEYSS